MTDLTVAPCPKCELPLDPKEMTADKLKMHADYCIGISPFVLHNRKAGMVVYLTTEEWDAMQTSNQTMADGEGDHFPESMALAIASRAVFGIADPTSFGPAEA